MFKILSRAITPNEDAIPVFDNGLRSHHQKWRRTCIEYVYALLFLLIIYVVINVWYPKSIHKPRYQLNTKPVEANTENVQYIHIKDSARPPIIWWTKELSPLTIEELYCANDENIGKPCTLYGSGYKLAYGEPGAYIFTTSRFNFNNIPMPRDFKREIWALYDGYSMNDNKIITDKILSLFNYSATFSRYSDVPFPLRYLPSLEDIVSVEHFVATPAKNAYLRNIAPILYIQSDCNCSTERDDYVREFMKYQTVDSYGTCLHNRKLPFAQSQTEDNLIKFIAYYKFVIVIENFICEDFISSKLWQALHLGVVPIYLGSESATDWFPNEKSAILIRDFPTPKLMSDHINKLMQDDDLYDSYLEHKILGKISNNKLMEELYERPYQNQVTKTTHEFLCFLCRRLYARNKEITTVVTKKHYNCSKPVSALTLKENPDSIWLHFWQLISAEMDQLYNDIVQSPSPLVLMKNV